MTNASATQLLQTLCCSNQWPQLQSITALESGYAIDLLIDSKIQWLTGHFPQQALIAGVVQTHWAGKFSETLFGVRDVKQIDNLKFQDVMLPQQTVQLSLEYNHDAQSVKFRYHKPNQSDQVFSEGKIQFNSVSGNES
jgi:3-hydroxymyristoyl/3-hydroxydecanoyl-(acyl carrier protein) dehydratase